MRRVWVTVILLGVAACIVSGLIDPSVAVLDGNLEPDRVASWTAVLAS